MLSNSREFAPKFVLQASLVGILETANSIYKRYRNQFMSSGLNKELAYSQQFVVPLLNTLKFITEQVGPPFAVPSD